MKTSRDDDKAVSLKRAEMVEQLRSAYHISSRAVLETMSRVRRHVYIPERAMKDEHPYGDHPCPIGCGQTISQPYIVAHMTEALKLAQGEKVLEIGTGSGYQAAVLAEMGTEVFSIEIIPELADHARSVLAAEGYGAVQVRTGDGHQGWPEHSPFDAIIVTCSPDKVPPALVDQLREGGRMILPLDTGVQRLIILRKRNGVVRQEDDILVRFVPMIGGSAA